MSVLRHPPYRIATPRLVLRCWNPDDAPRLHEAITESHEHLLPWMPWAADEPHDIDRRIEILRIFRGRFDLGEEYVYGIFDPEERRVLGHVVALRVPPRAAGDQIARRGLRAVGTTEDRRREPGGHP